MHLVSAIDLRTGAAFVLPGSLPCVDANPSVKEPSAAPSHPIANCRVGAIVHAEVGGEWLVLKVARAASA